MSLRGEDALILAYDYTEKSIEGTGALKGQDGKDGVSPIISVNTSTADTYKLDITDKNGTITTPNLVGKQGLRGEMGETGADGETPTITENADNTEEVYKLDFTTKNGTFTTKNIIGKQGLEGVSPSVTRNPDNTAEDYRLNITTKGGTFTTPNLRGPQGEVGPQGESAASAINPRGDYDVNAEPHYAVSDYITSAEGNTYVCKKDNPDNVAPTDGTVNDEFWQVLALRGAKGESGKDGEKGADGVTFTPSIDENGVLSFTNNGGLENPEPIDIKGDNGVTFTPSIDTDGYLSFTNNGNLENPEPIKVLGKDGEDGKDGIDGTTYVPSVGTVTTVESNTDVSAGVTVDEETKEAVFNFAIPKGENGADGFSPVITVTDIEGGHNVAIEDVNGVQNFDVLNGKDAEVTQYGLVTNAQNFKLDITKNHASWYGFFKLEYLYGTELCQVDVGIANTIDYRVTKGTNHIDKITYTVNGTSIVIGIDFIGKVYGTQVVEMPSEFGTINSLTAETYAGDTTATISTISEEPIILRYNMPETFSYSKYGITHNNTITEVVRAIGNYYASKYDNQNITLQVIISTNYNSSTFNKSLPCNGRSSITTITYMPYKFASRVKIETMNTHTGETYLGSLNDSETDDIVWKQIATKTYNSVAELNRAKGTNIELVNGEDNTQKIVDALSVGEQFISLYHNNANQNRFGIDVSYGSLINEIRIVKCLDADLTANYATVTAFMNTGCVMSRIFYKTYSTAWSSTKDYVDNAVSNSGNTFNGKEVKSITIDLSTSAFQVKGTSLYKIALDNYISANTNVIKVEGYYVPPTDANSTYKDKRYIVHTSDSDRAGGIRYYDGSWTTCVCQSESGSKKGSGYAKIYYIN